jgi:L-2,4-diaminobutyrate decarboxylase
MAARFEPAAYAGTAHATVDLLAAHVAATQRAEGPVTTTAPQADLARELDLHRLLREGGLDAATWPTFLQAYLDRGVHLHHPGSLAHQVTVPDGPGALADMVHGVINNPMGIDEMGAAAAAAERAVIAWMLERAGLPDGEGVLTHGGSLANLTALLAARAHAAPEAWTDGTPGDLVLLAPASAHYSVSRAAAIVGLGERALVELPSDDLGRIDPGALDAVLADVRRAGRRPLALVAAACATSTGLHDDLRTIGAWCRANEVWFHVDAAHGGSALLSPRLRARLDGIEQADSMIWDAHKQMAVSSLCAAVLVRRKGALRAAFRQQASYLFYEEEGHSEDLLELTVECTKAPLGVKLLLELGFRGEAAVAQAIERRHEVAREAARMFAADPDFEVPFEPESTIVCFRHAASDDAGQLAIRDRLMARGSFHLSSAIVAGRRHLRLVVSAPDTTERTIAALVEEIRRVVI